MDVLIAFCVIFVEELWKIHPEAVKIYASGACFKSESETKNPTTRNKGRDRK